jgi:hypothetical protein
MPKAVHRDNKHYVNQGHKWNDTIGIEESANDFEYGRPCETEPTSFEDYISRVPYLRKI